MLKAFLFDFGGTLDSDGGHWLDRFYQIYGRIGLPHISQAAIKDAFYWADGQAERELSRAPCGFFPMIRQHVRWQFERLGLQDPALEEKIVDAFVGPSDQVLRRNRGVLEHLHGAGFRLGVLSNFYGNVETLCVEYGLRPLLELIQDSAVIGLSKPDPRFFQRALDILGLEGAEVGFVGDSFERDISPAKAVGMRTFWLFGPDRAPGPQASPLVDAYLRRLPDLETWVAREKLQRVPA